MTVKMTSDYTRNGCTNTLIADWTDVVRFDSDGEQVRVSFRGTVDSVHLTGLVRAEDLNDKTKYRKTDEMIAELEGYAEYLSKCAQNYKQYNSSGYLEVAVAYTHKIAVINALVADLRSGDNFWDTDDDE